MTLSVKYNIVIPSTQGLDTKADSSKITEVKLYVAEQLSKMGGGCTVTEAEGYYVAQDGRLVIENTCDMYTIGRADNITSDWAKMQDLAKWVRLELNQECVLITNQVCDMELVGL